MKRTQISLLLGNLAVIALSLAVVTFLRAHVWLNGGFVARDVERLDLREQSMTQADFEAVQEKLPQCEILWNIPLQGATYPSDSTALHLKDADADAVKETLSYFTDLTRLTLTGNLPGPEELLGLREAFPEVMISWELEIGKQILTDRETSLKLDSPLSIREAKKLLSYFPNLEQADLRETGLTEAELKELADAFPDCLVLRQITMGTGTYCTDTETMDLSGQEIDLEELEAVLPYLHNLKTVDMCGCGLSDEEMDSLNKRYDPVRFIWTVKIRNLSIRTDATWFYPFKFDRYLYVDNKDLYALRYCEDMVCIDIGHNGAVTDCEWAAFMPNLKYLILGETGISDLSPLENCKNLVYLEMFTIPVKDYSPLLGCTALEDLNLGKTYGDPTPIAEMKWLKNLWWCDCMNTDKFEINVEQLLTAALPNTTIKFYPEHPTASGWRKLDNYFAMRDYLGMFYLN